MTTGRSESQRPSERDQRVLHDRVASLTDRVDEVGEAAERAEAASTALARSLEELLARHRKVDRALNLNSFVAYALFTVLIGGGFFALYRARTGEFDRELGRVAAARDAAERRGQVAAAELARRDEAARAARAVFDLFRDQRFPEAVAAYAALGPEGLGPTERVVLAEQAEAAQLALAERSLAAGKDAVRTGQDPRAAELFAEGLRLSERGPVALKLRYHRGVVLSRLGQLDEADRELSTVLAQGAEGQGLVEARFALAEVHERARRVDDARREYRAFVARSPGHPLARVARARLGALVGGAPTSPAARPAAITAPAARPAATTAPAAKPAPVRSVATPTRG